MTPYFSIADLASAISLSIDESINAILEASEPKFLTSADIVIEASGLRFEAIRAIAREKGVEIYNPACRCIDEDLLADLADAHIRRMKAYFHNASRHLGELCGEEISTFISFCQTFKNRHFSNNDTPTWKDIDSEAIREHFIHKVQELTSFNRAGSSSILKIISSESLYHRCKDKQQHKSDEQTYKQRSVVTERIISSHLFFEKPLKKRKLLINIRATIESVTLSARYHLFSSDDDHNHQEAYRKPFVFHAPAMVA